MIVDTAVSTHMATSFYIGQNSPQNHTQGWLQLTQLSGLAITISLANEPHPMHGECVAVKILSSLESRSARWIWHLDPSAAPTSAQALLSVSSQVMP